MRWLMAASPPRSELGAEVSGEGFSDARVEAGVAAATESSMRPGRALLGLNAGAVRCSGGEAGTIVSRNLWLVAKQPARVLAKSQPLEKTDDGLVHRLGLRDWTHMAESFELDHLDVRQGHREKTGHTERRGG